jgi:hypothetical protein
MRGKNKKIERTDGKKRRIEQEDEGDKIIRECIAYEEFLKGIINIKKAN